MKSFSEIRASFVADILPAVISSYGENDEPAVNEAWNNYTDSICRDGEMTDTAYALCPAYEDAPNHDDLSDDIENMLNDMGVVYSCRKVDARPDAHMAEMPRHFHCVITRGNRKGMAYSFYFSQGEAHTASPTLIDCLSCLLSDASSVDRASFNDWADDMGYDTDSRKAFAIYEACQATATALATLFTKQEIDDLHEMICEAGL